MLDKTTLQGMAATNEVVDAVRHKTPGAFGCREQPTSSVGGHDEAPHPERGRRIPCALAAMLATRRGIRRHPGLSAAVP